MKKKFAILITTTIIYLLTINTFIKLYAADINHKSSEDMLLKGRIEKSLEKINTAVEQNPNEPEYYKQRAKVYLTATLDKNPQDKRTLKNSALKDLIKARKLNPENLATLRNTTPLYFFLANKDLAKASSKANIDQKYLPIVKAYLKMIKNRYPNDVGVQTMVAEYEKRLGLEENLSKTKKEIKRLRPDLLEWYITL